MSDSVLPLVRRPERIVAAASHYDSLVFSMAPPARHGHVIRGMVQAGLKELDYAQGFLTSLGRYVSREEACKIARAAGQLEHRVKTEPAHMLFTEDIW